MVLNVSGSDEENDETQEESGVLYGPMENTYDSDQADIPHGSVVANPRATSLFATQRGWRVLRLPGARTGDEGRGGFANFMLRLIPGWKGQTIRDSPFRQMVTARMWQRYINNMEPIDDAVEIQAPYSPEEILSLRMFCEEWNNDPGHIQFTRRLINHPSTNSSDAILKGNMVYDLCTGQIQLRTSRGDRRDGNIPIRLAHDILTSIPFQEYNFYSLNSVHAQEGEAVYQQFLNRYVRLSSTEVAMVEEIEMGIRASGRAYATMSSSLTGDPIEAFALMQQTVEAMELGDTMTVRSQLNALLSPPYNFKSMAQKIDVGGTHGGRFVASDQIRYHRFNFGNLGTSRNTGNDATNRMIIAQGRDTSGNLVMWPDRQPDQNANSHPPLGFYMELNSSGTGVENIIEVLQVGNDKHTRVASFDEQAAAMSALVGGFNERDRTARDRRGSDANRDAADRRRGVARGPRANPARFGAQSQMGRGKYIYVELIPKKQMDFSGKHKGPAKQTQYWSAGSLSVADGSGLAKVFPGALDGGYFIKKGVFNRTGTVEPWLIGLPRKSFQAFTDSEGRRTIRPKHRKAEANPAWEKFTRFYGVPTVAGAPGKKNLFKIKKADRGVFYDKLRGKQSKR